MIDTSRTKEAAALAIAGSQTPTGKAVQSAKLPALSLTLTLFGATEAYGTGPVVGERTMCDHVTSTNLWNNVGALRNDVFRGTNQAWSALAWIPVTLQPGEKVGHVGFIAGYLGTNGTPSPNAITNCSYALYGPVSTPAQASLAVLNSPRRIITQPSNPDYLATKGYFLGIPLQRYDFDLKADNITAPPGAANQTLQWVAVAPLTGLFTNDVDCFMAFSTGGTNAVGTNSNLYVSGSQVGNEGPATVAELGGYPGDFFAAYSTAVPENFYVTNEVQGTNLKISSRTNSVIQYTRNAANGPWTAASSPPQNSLTVTNFPSKPSTYFRAVIAGWPPAGLAADPPKYSFTADEASAPQGGVEACAARTLKSYDLTPKIGVVQSSKDGVTSAALISK